MRAVKIKNTTDYPEQFLRRMILWVCKTLEADPKKLSEIKFRNRSGRTSGHCYSFSGHLCISVRWCGLSEKPSGPFRTRSVEGIIEKEGRLTLGKGVVYEPAFPENIPHQIDRMVQVTAHEIFHRQAVVEGIASRGRGGRSEAGIGKRKGSSERQTKWHDRMVLRAFQKNRDKLLDAWSKGLIEVQPSDPPPEPVAVEPAQPATPDFVQKRADKAAKKLAEWERRLKAARGKVQAYRRKVKYYASKGLAACPGK